jgi:pseudouridine synthase
MAERLQKVLAQWGIASRRQAETLITAGRVRVNGQVAQLGQKADPVLDQIELDGRSLSPQNRPDHHYLLLNKPKRVVCSCDDPQGRPTVLALLPPALRQGKGLHPVGRLDFNSTGALLITNDGELTYQLTHPRHHIPKTYRVVVAGNPSPGTLRQWQQGVMLDGQRTLPATVHIVSTPRSDRTELEIILHEGRNRQIRRVAELLGHPVKQLHRIAIGPLKLGKLSLGAVRNLTDAEIEQLCTAIDNR